MPFGAIELFIVLSIPLVAVLMIASAIRRLKRRLANHETSSLWTYINELGGYFVFGILILLSWLIIIVGIVLDIGS